MYSSHLEQFYHWEKTTPDLIFFRQPVNSNYIEYSFSKAGKEIRSIAAALKALDLPPNSKVSIMSKNCAHWIMADLAIWMAGHISVPLYPTLSAPSIRQILDHSEAKAIFIGKLDHYESQRSGIPDHLHKINFPLYKSGEGASWDDLLTKHDGIKEDVVRDQDELVTIMYTSGTTGTPKGVMFNFRQMMWIATNSAKQLQKHLGFTLHPKMFSYLPLSHIAERMITEGTGLSLGAELSFPETLESFGKNLAETQPHLFFGVPRIYMKFQEKVLEKLPSIATLIKIPIVNLYLRNKIKKTLGLYEAKAIGVGAAPVPMSLVQWYKSLGIAVRDIYGMTENAGYCTFNLASIKIGTVGQPWPGVEVKLSEQNEILTRHPGTMMGYYKEPALTKEVFDKDGFLKTGDVGEIDSEHFLKITGRIKDIFKTSKGKYVAPAPIEMHLLGNTDLDQVCVVGTGLPQPIAMVVLSAAGKIKSKEEVVKSLSRLLEETNSKLESYEKLKGLVIMKSDWLIDNGLLTPTLKVKRNEVENIHVGSYHKWSEEDVSIVWE